MLITQSTLPVYTLWQPQRGKPSKGVVCGLRGSPAGGVRGIPCIWRTQQMVPLSLLRSICLQHIHCVGSVIYGPKDIYIWHYDMDWS